jgi:hypothetical protein
VHRLGKRVLERQQQSALVGVHDGLRRRSRHRLLELQPVLGARDGDDAGAAERQRVAELLAELMLEAMVGELADHAAAGPAHCDRGEQLRLEQADEQPDPRPPGKPVTPQMIGGADDRHLAVLVMLDEQHALDLDLAGLDQGGDPLEVQLGARELLVGADYDLVVLAHESDPAALGPCAPSPMLGGLGRSSREWSPRPRRR